MGYIALYQNLFYKMSPDYNKFINLVLWDTVNKITARTIFISPEEIKNVYENEL